jgi:hypothetical protein
VSPRARMKNPAPLASRRALATDMLQHGGAAPAPFIGPCVLFRPAALVCRPSAARTPPRTTERRRGEFLNRPSPRVSSHLAEAREGVSADLTSKLGTHPPSRAVLRLPQPIHWTFCAANRTGVLSFPSQKVPYTDRQTTNQGAAQA